jgi:hypothetical protein
MDEVLIIKRIHYVILAYINGADDLSSTLYLLSPLFIIDFSWLLMSNFILLMMQEFTLSSSSRYFAYMLMKNKLKKSEIVHKEGYRIKIFVGEERYYKRRLISASCRSRWQSHHFHVLFLTGNHPQQESFSSSINTGLCCFLSRWKTFVPLSLERCCEQHSKKSLVLPSPI